MSKRLVIKREKRGRGGVSVIYPLYCLDFGFRLDFEMAPSEGGYEDIDFSLHVFNYHGIAIQSRKVSEREQIEKGVPRAFVEAIAFLSPHNIPPDDTPRIKDYFEIASKVQTLLEDDREEC